MKVATKFALAFLACGILSVLVYSSVAASREAHRTEETVAEDLASSGRTLSKLALAVWERDGEVNARELVGVTDRDEEFDVRWTWLDVDTDNSYAPRAPADVITSLRQGTPANWVRIKPGGVRKLFVYVPLLRPGQRPAALELSRPLTARSQVFWTEVRDELLASTLVAAFATFLAFVLTSWIVSRPLAVVEEQARRIGTGDLSRRLPVRGRDEVSSLVRELNAMCDQLRDARTRGDAEAEKRVTTLEQLRHADRLRTVGTLASGIAHELGTPLNVISMRAKMIATGEVPTDEAASNATIIAAQADRVTKIVRQLLDFARRRTPKRSDAELGDLAERAANLLSTLAKKSNVAIVVNRHDPVRAHVDAAQIEQALTNLVINAVHAMPKGGTVSIDVRRTRSAPPASEAERDCAVLEISDEGVGIAPEHLVRIFEPFFTTKGVGEGTGLGLSVTHGIAEDHEGWMTAKSTVGKGTTFMLYLPV
ncbi:sensory box histidine kinase/response regulator [Labilithrix luteola]|uniref:histidine kinase n=1 Tax=Labilithrix luteola TaxID=1391654 RepID=A0A0K1QCN4_9BACT|nr:HAMP domain-containing sensor histidine kinase [Labilithrix luteola]AKV03422.1 sensory box histidine kinase/response regulator [Labilithrix luteola]